MVLDFPFRAVLTRASDGNPLRRLDVRSKAREIGIVFCVLRHDGLLFCGGRAMTAFDPVSQMQCSAEPVRVRILGFHNQTDG